MMTKREGYQLSYFTTSLEEVVPEEHFFFFFYKAVDFRFIYDELAPYYSTTGGKPSIDPIIIVKQLLIGFLYELNSERRLEEECKYNVAYRGFLGLRFD
jgi:transposase